MLSNHFYYQLVMQGCDVAETILLKEKLVKSARIAHDCHGCDDPIQVGQSYWYLVYLVDGEIRYEKRHCLYSCK